MSNASIVVGAVSKVPAGPATSACVPCNPVSALPPKTNPLASVPPKEKPPIPCKILTAQITDPEGRKPNAQGLLYVVPPASKLTGSVGIKAVSIGTSVWGASSENLNGVATIQGGCGKHLEWEIATSQETFTKLGAAFQRAVPAPKPLDYSIPADFPFGRSRIRCVACEGGAREFTVLAVSGDELEFQFKVEEIASPFTNVLQRIGLSNGSVKSKTKKETTAKLGIKQAWEEHKESHRAHCTTKFDVSADPLFKIEGKFLCSGIKLPTVAGYKLDAGVFITLGLTIKLSSNLTIRKWADVGEWEYQSGDLTGKASGKGKLSAEINLINEKVMHAEASGETALEGTAGLHSDAKGVRFQAKWKPLTLTVELNFWDGWVESSGSIECFEEQKSDPKDFPIESFFGSAKA